MYEMETLYRKLFLHPSKYPQQILVSILIQETIGKFEDITRVGSYDKRRKFIHFMSNIFPQSTLPNLLSKKFRDVSSFL